MKKFVLVEYSGKFYILNHIEIFFTEKKNDTKNSEKPTI